MLAGSSETADAVYRLAGEVFADLVKSTGGDMGKLMDILSRASADPSGFASALSPADAGAAAGAVRQDPRRQALSEPDARPADG